MNRWRNILRVGLLLAVMAGCEIPRPDKHPLSEGDGLAHETLERIDSLMWQQPDSALAAMMEFLASSEADSFSEFEGHYCRVLTAELLFKNHRDQSNRSELIQTVVYFDSLLMMADGADTRDESAKTIAFLAAWAHCMNGVGYYENDSMVSACSEFLHTLEMMESHFPFVEKYGSASLQASIPHIPRFMGLTYIRLGDLFAHQFMQEPGIACYKEALAFDDIEPATIIHRFIIYRQLGLMYNELAQFDSADYYYTEAVNLMSDVKDENYRDAVTFKAMLSYNMGKGAEPTLDALKLVTEQSENNAERLRRRLTLGSVYYFEGQYDSALVYIKPVYEDKEVDKKRKITASSLLREIFMRKGDTLSAAQYAIYQAESMVPTGDSKALVSQLNELYHNYLQQKQERELMAERQQSARRIHLVLVAIVVLLLFVTAIFVVVRRGYLKRLERQKHETAMYQERTSQQLNEAQTALKQKTFDNLKKQAKLLYDKGGHPRKSILDAFNKAYPEAYGKLKTTYPDLTDQECDLLVLNFLQFRIKEEAEILDLSQNTVMKYRSDLIKKVGKSPVSDLLG